MAFAASGGRSAALPKLRSPEEPESLGVAPETIAEAEQAGLAEALGTVQGTSSGEAFGTNPAGAEAEAAGENFAETGQEAGKMLEEFAPEAWPQMPEEVHSDCSEKGS